MPPAVAVPLGLAAVGLVSQNANNKAAQKNNQNQQDQAVANARQAWQQAQQNVSNWEAANPSPIAGKTVAGPTAGAYGQGGTMAPSSYSAAQGAGGAPSGSAGGNNGLAGLIGQILQRTGGTPTTGAPGQPRSAQPIMRMMPFSGGASPTSPSSATQPPAALQQIVSRILGGNTASPRPPMMAF